ncbi:N-acetylmuramidase family protein [Pseudomonas aeruginosa]|uniref:N-acetylmuramidase family protein n=1 Tax=Pseudomonas aeruginosa TaxID=287 RepID=UPI0022EBD0E5|nr:N-acetylmuramidase family protein [Pseudomonas aeruginosa]HBN9641679.1 N-acetylmuramidase family protein [Pseudomonas aeruginosa]
MSQALKHGSHGQAVRVLQQQLNQRGATLAVDGTFGDATESAVRAFQQSVGMVPDGVAGNKTQAVLGGADPARFLRLRDLQAAATRLGVPLASVLAVNEVESAGAGFLGNGKAAILYERHIMYQRLALPRHPDDDKASLQARADELAAAHSMLVNPKPGGYIGGSGEYQRLAQARMLDALAADESTSWGAFQVMGYHAERLGYASVAEFVTRMQSSEAEHLEAFVRFIKADPALLKALKGRKWAEFARRYNGPAYARNLYDVKLERAYARHSEAMRENGA